jgi:DNA-binding PadR family transcriptional regulator
MTYPTALVLGAVANGYHYGFDMIDATGLASGTVYPILRRLERRGFVRSKWEDEAVATAEGRPQRRYYEISATGQTALVAASQRYAVAARTLLLGPASIETGRPRGR